MKQKHLRDYFAGIVLQELLRGDARHGPEDRKIIVSRAYCMADEMLEERNKEKSIHSGEHKIMLNGGIALIIIVIAFLTLEVLVGTGVI